MGDENDQIRVASFRPFCFLSSAGCRRKQNIKISFLSLILNARGSSRTVSQLDSFPFSSQPSRLSADKKHSPLILTFLSISFQLKKMRNIQATAALKQRLESFFTTFPTDSFMAFWNFIRHHISREPTRFNSIDNLLERKRKKPVGII